MELVNSFKESSITGYNDYYDYKIKKISSYDELIDYWNMDFLKLEEKN